MKLRFTFLLFLCVVLKSSWSQLIYHQDSFHGGITAGGFSTGMGLGNGIIQLYIEENSTIRKAFILAFSTGEEVSGSVIINSVPFIFDNSSIVNSFDIINQFFTPVNIHVIDATDFFLANQSDEILVQTVAHPEMPFRGIFAPYIYIEYENENLPVVNSCIILNEQFGNGLSVNNTQNLNPIDVNFPVGFSIYSDRHSYQQNERTNVYFNNNFLGAIYGSDNVNEVYWGGGVKGHFYYQNNELFGLDDDIANFSMNETDALCDVSQYLSNNTTNLNFNLTQVSYPNVTPGQINLYLAYFLTYTSPCQPFEATLLTSDTTTCVNSPIQLGVTSTGSMTAEFEWLPQTNLSCYDCPNPVFLGDSTTNYTVRIWASDSCSKVLPVRVRVLPELNFESIEITESVCGGATGSIAVASSGLSQPHSFQINGGTPQNNGNFSNLAAGEYTVTVTNAVGCFKDSVVVVGELNNVQAAFSVNPTTGQAPLDISITNQSQNASEYFWDFSDESGTTLHQGDGSLSGVEAPLAGLYTLTLVAGNGTPHCNDTTSVVILVKEPFEVFAYTFVTDDAAHYQIFLSGVSEYRYSLYSLDGKLVYQKSGAVENAGHVELWEIGNMASSMYLFRIWVKAESGVEEEVKGKLVVVR